MATKQRGILLISDITGYTAFLSSSELEHAQDSLRSLLKLLIDHTKSPLIISRLEGDAVISYAPESSFHQGQTIIEMIERTYVDFRRALELMSLNTTCTCNACRNIPNLDLKFFVHYGSFMLEPLHSYTELVGADVNLVHHLTKNSVTKKTSIKAYVLYTQAAVEGLGIYEIAQQMFKHTESYENIGDVQIYLQDMHAVWEEEKNRSIMSVQPEEASLTIELDFPISQVLMWDYITKPEYKAILAGSNSARVDNKRNGRIGLGATYYCAHGTSASIQTIVDWQPPDEYTYASDPIFNTYTLNTTRLSPTKDGTRLRFLVSTAIGGPWIVRMFFRYIIMPVGSWALNRNIRNLHQQIEIEIEEGRVLHPIDRSLPAEEVYSAVRESLAIE